MMTRRRFIGHTSGAILGGAAAVTLGCAARPEAAMRPRQSDPRPNIIFILADDLGYGDLGCYGQKVIQTPRIDRMAAEGVRFTQHYAGATVCAPSRCSLMTGLHTGHTLVRGNKEVGPEGQMPLAEGTMTVARVLQQAGYATALVGKWGLGGPGSSGEPNRQGFDEFFGYLCQRQAHNYYPDHLWRNTEKVPLAGNLNGRKGEYTNDLFTHEALDYIRRKQDRPFFLYLAPTIPHANNEEGARSGNGMEVPSAGPYADRQWPAQEKNFAAMMTRLDDSVGQVLALLKELGLDENTIVFFTSDNGPHKEGGNDPEFFHSAGPLRGIKRDLYEGGIRVPMIARWPGRIAPGSVSAQVWAFWDFLPTAAGLAGAGARVPAGIDGLDMRPVLLGQPSAGFRGHDFLYWEFHEGGSKQAVRTGDWKAVRLAPKQPLLLFDLKQDPGETRDLAVAHPEVVAKIEAYLATARSESAEWPLRAGRPATAAPSR